MSAITALAEKSKQIREFAWSRLLLVLGSVLFFLSFWTPPDWGNKMLDFGAGASAFICTPIWALTAMSNGLNEKDWQGCLCGFVLAAGWLANFTIVFRLSV